MKNNYFTCLFIFLIPFLSVSQNILCPEIEQYIEIDDVSNVPTITTNSGSNTINLIWQDQYITDIFANYDIYGFNQLFPSSSNPELLKVYTIAFNSYSLITDINTMVPNTVISIEDTIPNYTAIDTGLVSFLDGKQFIIKKYNNYSDADGCYPNCPLFDVPTNVDVRMSFNYDAVNDSFLVESIGNTPCGNTFSFTLRGGDPTNWAFIDSSLRLWTSSFGTITMADYNLPCATVEENFYNLFHMSCFNSAIGEFANINTTIDTVNNTILLSRDNGVFGAVNILLEESTLSVKEFNLETVTIFETKDNPYLQVANLKDNSLSIEIFSISGKLVLEKTILKSNTIKINHYPSSLYIIKASDKNNRSKIFKFIKR